MASTFLTWLVLFALYLLFAGQASPAELCAGVLVAVMGALLRVYVRGQGHRRMRLAAPWAKLAWRVGSALVRDTWKVGGGLLRATVAVPIRGVIQFQGLDPCNDTLLEVGRGAVLMVADSVAPNGFVIWAEQDSLLLHRLLAAPASDDRRWPV